MESERCGLCLMFDNFEIKWMGSWFWIEFDIQLVSANEFNNYIYLYIYIYLFERELELSLKLLFVSKINKRDTIELNWKELEI